MKLSISNIAWTADEDIEVYELMKKYHFQGLDIAPGRIFKNPFEVSDIEAGEYKESLSILGFIPAGMQSLLYGKQELNVFGPQEVRNKTFTHLLKMIDLAGKIGISVLVFGSPKNRLIGDISTKDAANIAIPFFKELGDYAAQRNISFCIEPNPKEYGADFITNTFDAIDFVRKINSDGLKLHLDLGTIIINDENIEAIFEKGIQLIRHIHISVPNLELICNYEKTHEILARTIRKYDYNHFVAIEMKSSISKPNTYAVNQALKFVSEVYGG